MRVYKKSSKKTAKEKFKNVVELTMEMDKVIMDLPVKPENAKKVLDVLYDEPIVSRKKILELIDIKPTTLNVCINALKEKNIIIETTGYSRNQVFAFQKYIDLFLNKNHLTRHSNQRLQWGSSESCYFQ